MQQIDISYPVYMTEISEDNTEITETRSKDFVIQSYVFGSFEQWGGTNILKQNDTHIRYENMYGLVKFKSKKDTMHIIALTQRVMGTSGVEIDLDKLLKMLSLIPVVLSQYKKYGDLLTKLDIEKDKKINLSIKSIEALEKIKENERKAAHQKEIDSLEERCKGM